MDLQKIRHQKARVIVGKNGINEGTLKEIQNHIKRNEFVKIKILKSALSVEFPKEKLIQELNAYVHVIEMRGYSVIVTNFQKK